MLSARERRFFTIAPNTPFLPGLTAPLPSPSRTNELREDARDDWRESETSDARCGTGGAPPTRESRRHAGSADVTMGV